MRSAVCSFNVMCTLRKYRSYVRTWLKSISLLCYCYYLSKRYKSLHYHWSPQNNDRDTHPKRAMECEESKKGKENACAFDLFRQNGIWTKQTDKYVYRRMHHIDTIRVDEDTIKWINLNFIVRPGWTNPSVVPSRQQAGRQNQGKKYKR